MRFMKRKRKEKRENRKKVDRLSQKSKKMKKVYAQDKKVVKEKIQGEKAKEKTDRTLRSSKKNLEQSSSVSDTFCIIYSLAKPGIRRPNSNGVSRRFSKFGSFTDQSGAEIKTSASTNR